MAPQAPTAKVTKPGSSGGGSDLAAMIEADNLSKFYGDFTACRDVSFTINRGEVAAFLGPNGAGKSTTMKLLTGYLAPSIGSARIAGYNMATERLEGAKHLGYLPENGPLYPDMTPRSLLQCDIRSRNISFKVTFGNANYFVGSRNLLLAQSETTLHYHPSKPI